MRPVWTVLGTLALYGLFLLGMFYMYKKFTKAVQLEAATRSKTVSP